MNPGDANDAETQLKPNNSAEHGGGVCNSLQPMCYIPWHALTGCKRWDPDNCPDTAENYYVAGGTEPHVLTQYRHRDCYQDEWACD